VSYRSAAGRTSMSNSSYFGATAADAQAELESHLGSLSAVERDNKALLDTAQLLALSNLSWVKVARDAWGLHNADHTIDALPVGLEVDGLTTTSFAAAMHLDKKLQLLGNGVAVSPALEYKKPYAKRRLQIQITSDLFTNADGQLAYNVGTRYVDSVTGAEDNWEYQDSLGGVWADQELVVVNAGNGQQGFKLKGQSLVLGDSTLMSTIIADTLNGDGFAQYINELRTNVAIRSNKIRGSHRAQLVFYTIFQSLQQQASVVEHMDITAADTVAESVSL
jgi:hypothetical protein